MISSDRYKSIVDLIDGAQRRGSNVVSFVDQMNIDLNNSEIPTEDNEKLRLENQITATSTLLTNRHNVFTTQMLKFVFQLQKYIDDNYTSVNDYLSNNNIQVKSVFAEISEAVGYLIDPSNIEGIS